jgi:hypothetical protein
LNWTETLKWIYAYLVAIIADLCDYILFFIFDIPILGDIADIFTLALLTPAIGKYALIGLFELVPVIGDLTPTHTLAVVMAHADIFGWRKQK